VGWVDALGGLSELGGELGVELAYCVCAGTGIAGLGLARCGAVLGRVPVVLGVEGEDLWVVCGVGLLLGEVVGVRLGDVGCCYVMECLVVSGGIVYWRLSGRCL
jgi:hypothetical protein